MLRFRRATPEPRLEMTPLIDVVFLLLTFFLFSLVLMVRADAIGVRLPSVTSGESARGTAAITVVLLEDGNVLVDNAPVAFDELGAIVRARVDAEDLAVFVAAEGESRTADLIRVYDALMAAGVSEFAMLGRPGAEDD